MRALYKKEAKPGIWMKTDEPIPEIGSNDVLIKIKKTSICGSDVHMFTWDEWAQKSISPGLILGHEYVGVVEKVGSHVTRIVPGERVSGEGHIPCGKCRNCRCERRHLCITQIAVGFTRQGAFADYIALPSANVIKIPDDISDDVAAFLDPLGNAVHTAISFNLAGEDVLVTGAGPIGAMACAVCRFIGARRIVCTDLNDYRLNLAKKMGATRCVDIRHEKIQDVMKELKMTEGFEVGLEMSGNTSALCDMIDTMRGGSKIAMLGISTKNEGIDWNKFVFKGLTIKGIYGREMYETWYKMIAMLQSGLDVTPMITHRFAAEDFQKAFEVMASGQSGKVILEWN